MKDLIVLAADKNIEYAVRGLLERSADLGIHPPESEVIVHPRRDPGCFNEAPDFLRPWTRQFRHTLVLFDYAGCGCEHRLEADTVADDLLGRLARNGWDNRGEVVVLNPELEAWVWSSRPYVDVCLGWAGRQPPLREWLAQSGFWPPNAPKPPDPKGAMEAALRQVRKPRSSAIYLNLARQATLGGHTERGFVRFAQALQRWFPR